MIGQPSNRPSLVEDLETWAGFFSRREQAFLEPFLLCPLAFQENLTGAILIASSPVLDAEDIHEDLEHIMEKAGMFLYRARQEAMNKLSGASVAACSPAETIDFCASILEKGLHSILVSIDPMLYIDSLDLNLDRYMLYEDISRILSSLVSGNGMACRTDDGKVLLVLESSRRMDAALVHSHILSALSSFLSKPPDSASLLCSVTVCPDDISDPAEAVGQFFKG